MMAVLAAALRAGTSVEIAPASVLLEKPEATVQIVVFSQDEKTGRKIDVTRQATLHVTPSTVAKIDTRGLISPVANGSGQVVVRFAGKTQSIPLLVQRLNDPAAVSFRQEITPILTKAGCNAGGCHGKADGQGGFKLSIFGFDPHADYEAMVMQSRGRRISRARPRASLIARKATARVPHGGGQKITPGSYRETLLLRWISEGAKFEAPYETDHRITGLKVTPGRSTILAGESLQLRVTATDASGRERCVTNEASFESNASFIAAVDARGLVQASQIPGEAAIMVRYLGLVAVCRITLPRPGVTFKRPPENNFVDGHVWDKLQQLGIKPSGPASDEVFLRRVFLDTTGALPTVEQANAFLKDTAKNKRAKLIDTLLDSDGYVDYWTMKWLDILRADQLKTSPQGAVAMQRWLRRSFQQNRPFDRLASDLLTARGNTSAEGPGSFYKVLKQPGEAARAVSQLLLGVRIECAQCHHHPSEKWSQADYVGLAGFFTGLKLKKLPGGEMSLVSYGGKDLPHPRTGEVVPARALDDTAAVFPAGSDRRRVLAKWVVSKENPFFAKAIANRLWAHYFGRGLIEPVDDIRVTNPASNAPLLQALEAEMHRVEFDLKAFTRVLLNSRVYQLSAEATPGNASDRQNFSHFPYKPLPAEVLLDSISQATAVAEQFNGWPEGYRAVQVWDNRMPSYFFRIFGRPVRATVCECERSNEPSIAQALHLLNSPEIFRKISHRQGRARRLSTSKRTPAEIIEELYLATLSRRPADDEGKLMLQAFAEQDRRSATEDVLWALLNSKEFLFNH